MTRNEQEYYHNVKKISESLESIAHSLEIISEVNIKVNADIEDSFERTEREEIERDLFKDEEGYIPFPEVEDSYDNSDYDGDS
jgi:hypothetical protein